MPPPSPRIAIVEDDTSLARALARLLRAVGWHAMTFPSAEALLQATPPPTLDGLLLDVGLPGMSGVACLEHLRARGCILPAIFITGRGAAVQRRATQAGAVAWLRKPLEEHVLLQALQRALGPPAAGAAISPPPGGRPAAPPDP